MLCGAASIHAEEGSPAPAKNEFGLHVGATTGIGLSYRRWFADFGTQLTAAPIFTDDFDMVSTGLTLMYSIKNETYYRFFIYLGSNYFYTRTTDSHTYYQAYSPIDPIYVSYSDKYITEKIERYDESLNFGFGPGFAWGKTIRFNLMAGYGIYNVTGKISSFPTGEIGLYYNF
jgi:hypothetical protein